MLFRRINIAIAVSEITVIKRITTVNTPTETPNTRPLTVDEPEVPVTVN